MEQNNKNFIKTSDESTAKTLIAEGFTLLEKKNGCYTFLNNKGKMNFTTKNDVFFTNKICI